jgi:hypothetical protein
MFPMFPTFHIMMRSIHSLGMALGRLMPVSHCKSVKAHNQIQPFNLKPPAVPALKY